MIKDNPDDAHFFKLMTSGKDDQIVLIEYFMEIYKQSRQRIFQETIQAQGEYMVTAELNRFLQNLLQNESWT